MFSQNNKSTLYRKTAKTAVKIINTNKLRQFTVLDFCTQGYHVFVADSDAEGDEDLSAELAALKMDASKPVKRQRKCVILET